MSIGIIIGSRISNVLEAALRFGCGIAVIGVAIEVVTYVAHAYRTLADADKEKIKQSLRDFHKDKQQLPSTHKKYETQIMVQWHVAIISAVVLMAIFIVACELAVGDFTQSLIQSLSVGIGFGLRDLVEDALYGILAMTQGYGTKYKFTNIKPSKHKSADLLTSTKPKSKTTSEDTVSTEKTTTTTTSTGCRIYQAHLTHVVLVPCDEVKPNTFIVKRWSEFYNTMEYQDMLLS